MLQSPRNTLVAFATLAALGATGPAFADGPVLVTVSGAVESSGQQRHDVLDVLQRLIDCARSGRARHAP